MQKAKERYSKEKNCSVLFRKQRNNKKSQGIDTKTCQKKKKTKLKRIKEKDISNWFSTNGGRGALTPYIGGAPGYVPCFNYPLILL